MHVEVFESAKKHLEKEYNYYVVGGKDHIHEEFAKNRQFNEAVLYLHLIN